MSSGNYVDLIEKTPDNQRIQILRDMFSYLVYLPHLVLVRNTGLHKPNSNASLSFRPWLFSNFLVNSTKGISDWTVGRALLPNLHFWIVFPCWRKIRHEIWGHWVGGEEGSGGFFF